MLEADWLREEAEALNDKAWQEISHIWAVKMI
jgi:hypothetical protein